MLHYFNFLNDENYVGELQGFSNGFFEINWLLHSDDEKWKRFSYSLQSSTNPENISYINSSLVGRYCPVDEDSPVYEDYYRVKNDWLNNVPEDTPKKKNGQKVIKFQPKKNTKIIQDKTKITRSRNFEDIPIPVVIYYDGEQWINYDLHEKLEWGIDYDGEPLFEKDFVVRKLSKVFIENDKGNQATFVMYSADLEDNIITTEELRGWLECYLHQDVFVANDEQFIFTDFGEKISNAFRNGFTITYVSPDVGLDDDYSYNS